MTDYPQLNTDCTKPMRVTVTSGDFSATEIVNTYGRVDVLFAGIQQLTGLNRNSPIPAHFTIKWEAVK